MYSRLEKYFLIGYASEILKVVLHLSKEQRTSIFNKYQAKEPASLTSQFKEQKSKTEAIKEKDKRSQNSTTLFPSGNYNLVFWLLKFHNKKDSTQALQ